MYNDFINEQLECPGIFTWMKVVLFMGQFLLHMVQQQISIILHHLSDTGTNTTRQYDIIRGPHFQGDHYRQNTILSAYGYGMVFSTLVSGYISLHFSCYNLMLGSFLISAYFSILSAPSVFLHWICLFGCRFILGFTSGIQYSALEVLDYSWTKGAASNYTSKICGGLLGCIFCIYVTIWVSHDINWMWGFYITAILIIAYCIVFYVVATDHPRNHPRVQSDALIHSSRAVESVETFITYMELARKLVKTKYFWSLSLAFFGHSWNQALILLLYPIFIYRVIDSDSTISLCIICSIPTTFRLTSTIIFGFLRLYQTDHEKWPHRRILKHMIFMVHILPGILYSFLAIKYFGSLLNRSFLLPESYVIIIISISEFLNGGAVSTVYENPRQLTKNFSFLISLMHFFAAAANVLVPTGNHLVEEKQELLYWGRIFAFCGVVNITTGVVYLFVNTVEDQNW